MQDADSPSPVRAPRQCKIGTGSWVTMSTSDAGILWPLLYSVFPLPRRLANSLGRCVRSCATQISLHMTLHCNWVRPDSGLVGSVCLYSRKAMAHETPRCVSPRLRWPISGQDLLPSGLADRQPRCGLNCLRKPNIVGGRAPSTVPTVLLVKDLLAACLTGHIRKLITHPQKCSPGMESRIFAGDQRGPHPPDAITLFGAKAVETTRP